VIEVPSNSGSTNRDQDNEGDEEESNDEALHPQKDAHKTAKDKEGSDAENDSKGTKL